MDGDNDGQLNSPSGIVVDPSGEIFIAEGADVFVIGMGDGEINKFSYSVTPVRKASWGAVKWQYR
jgi:hypothetical protein